MGDINPRVSGLVGARRRWGPPRHLPTGDLPAPERAAVADLIVRVRLERARQGLPPTVSDRKTVAAIAAVLTKSEAPVIEPSGASAEVRNGPATNAA
jgi:hypothetical protein